MLEELLKTYNNDYKSIKFFGFRCGKSDKDMLKMIDDTTYAIKTVSETLGLLNTQLLLSSYKS